LQQCADHAGTSRGSWPKTCCDRKRRRQVM
jgi:hypothetical protein